MNRSEKFRVFRDGSRWALVVPDWTEYPRSVVHVATWRIALELMQHILETFVVLASRRS